MPRENVVEFVTRLNQLREKNLEHTYFPSENDVRSFLLVLNFIKHLSVSHTGKIGFDDDQLKIVLTNYVVDEDINDYGVLKSTALHQEATMNFMLENGMDEELVDNSVDDLLDCLDGLVKWMDDESENDNET